MDKIVSFVRFVPLIVAVLALAGSALAQTQQQPVQQPREDNRWGGMAHQPTEADIQRQEKAVGIVPLSQQQRKAADQDLQKMYHNLMGESAPGY
jgi:hypothetical protein